ncbi:hypothetical protein GW17_00029500 [Ensete ventricosum]|nr:hypothetical protein GW17_00029500 [Ensete ventricosum]
MGQRSKSRAVCIAHTEKGQCRGTESSVAYLRLIITRIASTAVRGGNSVPFALDTVRRRLSNHPHANPMRGMPVNDRDGCPGRNGRCGWFTYERPYARHRGLRFRTGHRMDPSNPKGRPSPRFNTSEAAPHRKRRLAVGPAVPSLSGHVVTSGSSSEPGPPSRPRLTGCRTAHHRHGRSSDGCRPPTSARAVCIAGDRPPYPFSILIFLEQLNQ